MATVNGNYLVEPEALEVKRAEGVVTDGSREDVLGLLTRCTLCSSLMRDTLHVPA